MALSLQLSISDATTAQCSSATIGAGAAIFDQWDWSDAALDDIGIDLDPPVVEEAGQTVPPREHTDCLSELGLLADQGELVSSQGSRPSMIRPAPVLADGAAFVASRLRTSFLIA